MHLILLAFILLVSSVTSANTASDEDFRVSGIMRLGGNNYRGLLEFENGEKLTVAIGDDIGLWQVDGISEYCLVLSQQNKRIKKCLVGAPESEKATVVSESWVEKVEAEVLEQTPSHFKQVNKTDLLQGLDSIVADSKEVTMDQLNSAILPLIFSNHELRITEIDAQEPKTAEIAIDMIRKAAEQRSLVRLTVKNEKEQNNVYYIQLTP